MPTGGNGSCGRAMSIRCWRKGIARRVRGFVERQEILHAPWLYARLEAVGRARKLWRERKGTEEARTPYRHRAAVAERVNARARDRSLIRLPVRGITKVKAAAHLYALTHNLMRMIRPAPEMSRMETRSSEIEPPAAEPWKPPRNRPITA